MPFCSTVRRVQHNLYRTKSETIAKTGDKDEARKTMRAAGVPVIPGCDAVADVEEAKAQAKKIGFPLLIKARAGGGGRGIRLSRKHLSWKQLIKTLPERL